MLDLTPKAFAVLRRQHGHTTIQQLSDAGVGRNARRRLVAGNALIVVHRNVVRIASAPITFEGRCVEISLAHASGYITGPPGGRLLGLRRMPHRDRIDVCVPHGLHLTDESVRLRQCRKIGSLDVVRLASGILMASGPRLAFDLARDLSPLDHASVVEQLLEREKCTMQSLGATARRLCHPTRPGSLLFAKTLMARGERPAAESHYEVVLGEALRARGIPVVPQVADLQLPNGSKIRIDLAVPELRWAVEIDVHPDHLFLEGTTRDKRRDRQCHLIGWQVERATKVDFLDLAGFVDELVDLYEVRLAAAA